MLRVPGIRGPQHVGLSAVFPVLRLQAILYPACALVVLHLANQFVFPALHTRDNTSFDCTGCTNNHPTAFHPTVRDTSGRLSLILALYHPAVYRQLFCVPGFKIRLLGSFWHSQEVGRRQHPGYYEVWR